MLILLQLQTKATLTPSLWWKWGKGGQGRQGVTLQWPGAIPGWWHKEEQFVRGVLGGQQSSPVRTSLRCPQVAAAVCPQLQDPVAAAGLEEPLVWLFLHEFIPSPTPAPIPSQAVPKKGQHSGEHCKKCQLP